MRFSANSKSLFKSLVPLSKVVNTHSPTPIMHDFLFKAGEGSVFAIAANEECMVALRLPGTRTEAPGEFCTDAKFLMSLLRKIGDGDVTMTLGDNALEVRYPRGKYVAPVHEADKFPEALTVGEVVGEFDIDAFRFARGIERVLPSASRDTVRPILNGVCVDIFEDRIVFVATDTHILAKYTDRRTATGLKAAFVIPARTCDILLAMLREGEKIHVAFGERRIRIGCEGYSVVSALMNGKFPDYERVIPKEPGSSAIVNREDALDAAERACLCASQDGDGMIFRFAPGSLSISMNNVAMNRHAEETIPCDTDKDAFTLCLAAVNFKSMFESIESETVEMRLIDRGRPLVAMPTAMHADEELVVMGMPMRMPDYLTEKD